MLDRAALVACWREGLLAQKVLLGQTKGYRHHPQLQRFRIQHDPVAAIGAFLHGICDEADARSYSFNRQKIVLTANVTIPVTAGQLNFEREHLRDKVARRAPKDLYRLSGDLDCHPIFHIVPGDVEPWERGIK